MESYSKSFLAHGVACELAVEVSEKDCRILALVSGIPIHDVKHIPVSELEGALLTAERIAEQEAEKQQPLGSEVASVVKLLLRLGYTKQL